MENSKVMVIDGGVGTEISRRGIPLHPVYWSAVAHIEHSDLVRDIHLDYINAGADIISTNTFMAGRHLLEAGGRDDFEEVNRKAVAIAKSAKNMSRRKHLKIAGTLSPTARLDRAHKLPRGKKTDRNFRDQATLLTESGVDVLLVELLFDSESANGLLEACCDTGLPVWAGVSATKVVGCDTLMTFRQPGKHAELLPHETFENLLETVSKFPLDVLGVMHTDVTLMQESLHAVRDYWTGKMLAYAKTGIATDHDWEFSDIIDEVNYADLVAGWIHQFDVSIVGGCCGTRPSHISALVKKVNNL